MSLVYYSRGKLLEQFTCIGRNTKKNWGQAPKPPAPPPPFFRSWIHPTILIIVCVFFIIVMDHLVNRLKKRWDKWCEIHASRECYKETVVVFSLLCYLLISIHFMHISLSDVALGVMMAWPMYICKCYFSFYCLFYVYLLSTSRAFWWLAGMIWTSICHNTSVILTFTERGSSLDVRIWHLYQAQTSKGSPRTERITNL